MFSFLFTKSKFSRFVYICGEIDSIVQFKLQGHARHASKKEPQPSNLMASKLLVQLQKIIIQTACNETYLKKVNLILLVDCFIIIKFVVGYGGQIMYSKDKISLDSISVRCMLIRVDEKHLEKGRPFKDILHTFQHFY